MKLQLRQWSERPRTLVLMLAIMLPAVALIVFGAIHLWGLERDKTIEAAIQKDYAQFLAIAEKQIDARAYDIADDATAKFPDIDNADDIDSFLNAHPEIAHAFLWTGKGDIEFRSQMSRMSDRQFCSESRMLPSEFGSWLDLEGKSLTTKVKHLSAATGRGIYFDNHWINRGDKMQYQTIAFFLPLLNTLRWPDLSGTRTF
jgi:hypothetical protein